MFDSAGAAETKDGLVGTARIALNHAELPHIIHFHAFEDNLSRVQSQLK
jgi:hypothetical protein